MPRLKPNQVSDAVRRLNPAIFGPAVRPVDATQRERGAQPTLDRKPTVKHRSKRRVVVVVTIIAMRHRLIDDDNNEAGSKPLRDAIATSLGVDDGDGRVSWCYGQVRTDGQPGCLVRIERL